MANLRSRVGEWYPGMAKPVMYQRIKPNMIVATSYPRNVDPLSLIFESRRRSCLHEVYDSEHCESVKRPGCSRGQTLSFQVHCRVYPSQVPRPFWKMLLVFCYVPYMGVQRATKNTKHSQWDCMQTLDSTSSFAARIIYHLQIPRKRGWAIPTICPFASPYGLDQTPSSCMSP